MSTVCVCQEGWLSGHRKGGRNRIVGVCLWNQLEETENPFFWGLANVFLHCPPTHTHIVLETTTTGAP